MKLGSILADAVSSLASKASAAISKAVKVVLRRKAIDDAATASVKPLKGATTGEEIDKASDPALGRW